MKILVTGSTGLVGKPLVAALLNAGHTVKRLIRATVLDRQTETRWNPADGTIDPAALEGLDAVVHLAGENIAAGRWNAAKKARIRESRVNGTKLLCQTLASLSTPPATLISASAVGYYGHRRDTVLREDSGPGSGFLPEVCHAWEDATQPAAEKDIRVVLLRTGVVLTPAGGALAQMLTPFKMGLGGRIGSGRQFMSWIALDDLLGIIEFALNEESLAGPVNAVAPNPVTNAEFTKTLGRALKRPTLFPMPALAARLAFGQMADDLLLASARVLPARLTSAGFNFRFPALQPALHHLLSC